MHIMSIGNEETFLEIVKLKQADVNHVQYNVFFQTEDIRGIQCFHTESVKCLLQNYKQNIHHGLQCYCF
jgi:hypothetical protein